MKRIMKIGAYFVLVLLSFPVLATLSSQQQQADEAINQLYHRLSELPNHDMENKLDFISAQFLGKKYQLGALGEGPDAQFDQEPRYRMDSFDCDTFVTTVLALALALDKTGFQQCLAKIRYKEGRVDFLSRNHFVSLDWNPNNQKQGFLQDITLNIKDQNNHSVSKLASALIDKPSWYQHFTTQRIRLNPPNSKEQAKRLIELKALGQQLTKKRSDIPYIPFSVLFDPEGHPNKFIFNQIPSSAIIEIIRPNWNLKEQIGTNLNVSHLGFVFRKNGIIYFRQASSTYGKVVDVPLINYLQAARKSPTIKGIHIEIILPTASCLH